MFELHSISTSLQMIRTVFVLVLGYLNILIAKLIKSILLAVSISEILLNE